MKNEFQPLGNYITESSVRNKQGNVNDVYSVTNSKGFCKGYFSKEVAGEDKTGYKVVHYGNFAYNPSRINVGSVDWFKESEGIVSPLYVIFSTSNDLDNDYLKYYLKSDIARTYIRELATGSVRDNLRFSILEKLPIKMKDLNDQRYEALTLSTIDSVQSKLAELASQSDMLVKSRHCEGRRFRRYCLS